MVRSREDWLLQLNNELFIEGGFFKILAVTAIVLLISHGLDLYDSSSLGARWDQIFRLLLDLVRESGVHRVIVAMPDRRGTLPVDELLNLRLDGVKVEEATSWLERINGRIEVEKIGRAHV